MLENTERPVDADDQSGDRRLAGAGVAHEHEVPREVGLAKLLGGSERGSTIGTARNGSFVSSEVDLDESFWRIVGLYLAEGNCYRDRRGQGRRERIIWSFHPTREQHLVDEVRAYWARQSVETRSNLTPTCRTVVLSSRLVGSWWTDVFGLGRTSYEQRLPDLIWDQTPERKRALLSGLWEGDGSWDHLALVTGFAKGQYPLVAEWGTSGAIEVLKPHGPSDYVARGWTYSENADHWLQKSYPDMEVALLHIDTTLPSKY